VCRAAQPLAAIAASRYALNAEGVGAARPGACGSLFAASRYALGAGGVGAARPGACGSLFAASRYALGAGGVGAARPGAYMCSPPDTLRTLPLGGGDVEDVVRFALLETLGARRASRSCRGRGWGGVVQTCTSQACGATLVRRRSMCSASRSGASLAALGAH